jgi:hypothetical protein
MTSRWWGILLAATLSAGANILALLVGRNLFGVSFLMPVFGSENVAPLGLLHVALVSAVPALFAAGLLSILRRFTQRPLRAFWIIAGIVLLVSFLPDLILPVDRGTRIGLMAMHVIAALAIVGVLTGVYRAQQSV